MLKASRKFFGVSSNLLCGQHFLCMRFYPVCRGERVGQIETGCSIAAVLSHGQGCAEKIIGQNNIHQY